MPRMFKDGKPSAGHEAGKEKSTRDTQHRHNMSDKGGSGHDVKENPRGVPKPTDSASDLDPKKLQDDESLMNSDLMGFTTIIENLQEINNAMDGGALEDDMSKPIDPESVNTTTSLDYDELLNNLNQIFTPTLIANHLSNGIADQVTEACSEDNILFENNVIRFDNQTKMSQLLMVCAMLIARQKNTPNFQIFEKSFLASQKAKLAIQKEEYAAALALSQRYLIQTSTGQNSSVARDAAKDLMPISGQQ